MSSPRKCCARSARAASSKAVASRRSVSRADRATIGHLLVTGRMAPAGRAVNYKKWTCDALRRSLPSGQDEGVRPVLPGRQGGRDRRRAMDPARPARAALREPSLQRPPPGVPLMSPTLLAGRLEQLEDAGIVRSVARPRGRGREYHLTAAGEELRPLIDCLGEWGQRWARAQVDR